MTVFNTFLKILNKNKAIVLMYTIILLVFGTFNMKSQEQSINFAPTKPEIAVINQGEDTYLVKDFMNYLENNSKLIDLEEDQINDALFYREVNYVVYLKENFTELIEKGEIPEIEVKSTGTYQASIAKTLVSRYLKIAKLYGSAIENKEERLAQINEDLSKNIEVEITSSLDTNTLSKIAFYFNFESYSLLACLIYVICLILSIFNQETIRKRTVVSSTNIQKNNRILLLSNCIYSFVVWLFYLIISIILLGNAMFTIHGFMYALNSLIFTFLGTTLAFLLGNIVKSKNAINGIVNVIALGSSFLCGAFVPMAYLPSSVLDIAHFLPTYYYIKTNEILTTLEVFNLNTLKPILINMGIILLFSIIFIILTNLVSKKRRKIG